MWLGLGKFSRFSRFWGCKVAFKVWQFFSVKIIFSQDENYMVGLRIVQGAQKYTFCGPTPPPTPQKLSLFANEWRRIATNGDEWRRMRKKVVCDESVTIPTSEHACWHLDNGRHKMKP